MKPDEPIFEPVPLERILSRLSPARRAIVEERTRQMIAEMTLAERCRVHAEKMQGGRLVHDGERSRRCG